MRRSVWITLAALAVFAAIVLARAPASWVVPSGPDSPIACAAVDGTLWSGVCTGLSVRRQPVGDLSWDFLPRALLRGRVGARVTLSQGQAHAAGDLEAGLGGRIVLRNVQADFPLDPKLVPGIPATLHGNAHADFALARLRNGVIEELQGQIEAHDLEDRAGHVTPLGSYRIRFPGGAQANQVGQLRDLGGPLSIEGTVTLRPNRSFDVQALVAARPEATPELANNLRYLGSPDAAGRRQFSMSGSL